MSHLRFSNGSATILSHTPGAPPVFSYGETSSHRPAALWNSRLSSKASLW